MTVCVLCPGQHFFTIGQRARLEGMANAWFVAGKDPQNNTITVVCLSHSQSDSLRMRLSDT